MVWFYFMGVTLNSEKAMATHSSTLAWKIPWTEKPGRLQSMESLGVEYDWATSLSLFTFMPWRRQWQPTPVFLPGESQDGGAWWATVCGVTQTWIRLKRLSSSSSSNFEVVQIYSNFELFYCDKNGSWFFTDNSKQVLFFSRGPW